MSPTRRRTRSMSGTASCRSTASRTCPGGGPRTPPPSTSPRSRRRERAISYWARQPHGLEGFLHVRVHLHPDRLSVPERPHLSEAHVDGNSRGLRAAPLVDDRDDALPGVDVILDLELPVIPRVRPLGVEPVRALGAGVDLLVGPAEPGHVPDEIGMGADLTGGLPVLVAASDDLDVLLRHRRAVEYARPALALPPSEVRESRTRNRSGGEHMAKFLIEATYTA